MTVSAVLAFKTFCLGGFIYGGMACFADDGFCLDCMIHYVGQVCSCVCLRDVQYFLLSSSVMHHKICLTGCWMFRTET